VTLIDAGRLFGRAPVRPRAAVLLRNLPVETALAVDAVIGPEGGSVEPAEAVELTALREHPALQPGAACGRPN
jgi:hypothetical protein